MFSLPDIARNGSVIAIVGGPGIGKTRLTMELRDLLLAKAREDQSPHIAMLEESIFLYTTFTNGTVLIDQERDRRFAVERMGIRVLHSFFASKETLANFRARFLENYQNPFGAELLQFSFLILLRACAPRMKGEKLVVFFAVDEFSEQVEALGKSGVLETAGYQAFLVTLKKHLSAS